VGGLSPFARSHRIKSVERGLSSRLRLPGIDTLQESDMIVERDYGFVNVVIRSSYLIVCLVRGLNGSARSVALASRRMSL
jgi:hypothetical protein